MSDTSGRPTSRDAIFAAAKNLFTEHGYAATTVREIASAASLDPALVIRHFGSKEALFLEVMRLDIEQSLLFGGPLDELGVHYIRTILDAEGLVRSIFLALVRASGNDGVGLRLLEVHETQFVAPLAARLTGVDGELRARMAAALVGGLLYSLWVVGDETLAKTDDETIARMYGALLQRLISPGE